MLMASVRFVSMSFASLRSAPVRSAPMRSTPLRSGLLSGFDLRQLFQATTPCFNIARSSSRVMRAPHHDDFHFKLSAAALTGRAFDVHPLEVDLMYDREPCAPSHRSKTPRWGRLTCRRRAATYDRLWREAAARERPPLRSPSEDKRTQLNNAGGRGLAHRRV